LIKRITDETQISENEGCNIYHDGGRKEKGDEDYLLKVIFFYLELY